MESMEILEMELQESWAAMNRASAIRFLAMLTTAERAKYGAEVIAFLEQN